MTIRRVLCCTPDWKAVLLLVILCCVAMHQRDAFSQGGNATDPLKGGIRVVENLEIAAIRSGSGNQIHSWDRENSIHYAWGAGFGDASDWREIVTGDFDGDGLDEIAAIRKSSGGKLFIWDWDGSHGITEFEGWGAASEWRGLAAGNFDDDEADELVAVRTNVSGAQFVVWDGNGTCSQSWGDGFYDQSDWRGVIAADVDGDGVDEVVALRRSSAYNIYAWKINGQSRTLLKETGNYGSGSDWRGLTAGDFDGDGIDEVAAVRTGVSTEQFFIWDLYGGSPTLSWGAGFGDQSDWRGIAAGDFDADGADEVVAIRRTSGNNVFIHDPNNGVTTSNFGQYGPNSDWRGLATGDFDADGADEIAAVRANDNVDQFFIWVRSQQNEFVTADQWQLSSVDWRGLAVGNFDGDGISLRFTGNSVLRFS